MNTIVMRGRSSVDRSDSPCLKSKNDMLKIEDKNVPGRKVAPRNASVFIEILSRLMAPASRRSCVAISRLSLDSTCPIILFICQYISLRFWAK